MVTERDEAVVQRAWDSLYMEKGAPARVIAAYREEVTAPLIAALRDLVNSNGLGVGALKNARALLEKVGNP